MKKNTLVYTICAFMLVWSGPANAATASDFIEAVRSIVTTGLSNADSAFVPLRGAAINQIVGERYQVNKTFGEFFPDCHISGYLTPLVPRSEWVLACSSPGLSADNVSQLRGLIYQGVVRSLPACFARTLEPGELRDEDFRWDCRKPDRSLSVDVSGKKLSNGHMSFLLEVYEYFAPSIPDVATPAPSPTPTVVSLLKPQPTVAMGGVEVPYADYATLSLSLPLALSAKPNNVVPHVVETLKAGNEMPPYDWMWHYAGKQSHGAMQTISVWVCANLSPQEQQTSLKQATLMGLLDSGEGGTILQQAYASARKADEAIGPQAPDPFMNRRKLIFSVASYFR